MPKYVVQDFPHYIDNRMVQPGQVVELPPWDEETRTGIKPGKHLKPVGPGRPATKGK